MADMKTPHSIVTLTLTTALLVGIALAQERPPTREELLEMRRLEISTKRTALERRRLMKLAQAPAAQNDFDATYYQLDLDIYPADSSIAGLVELRALATVDSLETVVLNLDSSMTVDSVGGDALGYTRSGDFLLVELSLPVPEGDTSTVQVAYHGRPARSGFGAFGFNDHDGDPIIWSLSEPYGARAWWPCKDTPSDKADSVDIIVTVPTDLIVASNGSLVSTEANGDGTHTFHWHESYPITTYLVSLAITNYATYSEWFRYAPDDSMEVCYYIYPEDSARARSRFTETVEMLACFHDIFGPYPFLTEKYGIAQFPWGGRHGTPDHHQPGQIRCLSHSSRTGSPVVGGQDHQRQLARNLAQ